MKHPHRWVALLGLTFGLCVLAFGNLTQIHFRHRAERRTEGYVVMVKDLLVVNSNLLNLNSNLVANLNQSNETNEKLLKLLRR